MILEGNRRQVHEGGSTTGGVRRPSDAGRVKGTEDGQSDPHIKDGRGTYAYSEDISEDESSYGSRGAAQCFLLIRERIAV